MTGLEQALLALGGVVVVVLGVGAAVSDVSRQLRAPRRRQDGSGAGAGGCGGGSSSCGGGGCGGGCGGG